MSHMDKGGIAFLVLFIFFGTWLTFFPEKVFHFREGRKFKYPPEPSNWALWNIRIQGIIAFLLALGVIYLCWLGGMERFFPSTASPR